MRKKYKGKVPIIGKVVGPWSLAYNVYGVENLILESVLNPNKVKELIAKLLIVPMTFARMQFDAGIDYLTWAEHVTADLVSPAIYEEFVLPMHRKATDELNHFGPTIMHVCGNVMDRIDLFRRNGMVMLHLDSRNKAKDAIRLAGETKVTGFVNNPVLLLQGKPNDVRQKVVDLLNQGVKFVSPECAVPLKVPAENLKALASSIHSFSPRYAL